MPSRPHALTLRGKFPQVLLNTGPALYAAALSNGVVKVGYSRSPRTRMSTLATDARNRYGAEVVDFRVGPIFDSESAARAIERQVLDALSRCATCLPGRREYFTGITFDAAVQLLQARAA